MDLQELVQGAVEGQLVQQEVEEPISVVVAVAVQAAVERFVEVPGLEVAETGVHLLVGEMEAAEEDLKVVVILPVEVALVVYRGL
jgi:hypothetical protein